MNGRGLCYWVKLCLVGVLLGSGWGAAAPCRAEEEAPPTGEREKIAAPEGVVAPSGPVLSALPGEVQRDGPAGPEVPIALDTVLRLAEEHNPQIALARARVNEACAEVDLAGKRFLPDIYVGAAYYRHEGGIQDEDGTFIHSSTGAMLAGLELHGRLDLRAYAYQKVSAQRKHLQQQGELSRITNETLLDSASTYLDLLAARTAEAIARELEKDLRDLLPQAEKMAKDQPAAEVEVERIKSEIAGRQQNRARFRSQAEAASIKLIYLLGLDCRSVLLVADREIVPIELVDVRPCVDALVAKALSEGPGIRELESLLNLVEDAVHKAQGPGRLLPVVEVNMIEGAFGAGPGGFLEYDNRYDLGLHVRWNLADFATRNERRRIAQAQREQAHLAYQDLKGKLTAGVQEARESILSGAEQIKLSTEQLEHAHKARERSKLRLEKNVPGATATEMLLNLQSLSLAQVGRLTALRDYNKAQLRLLLLLGCRP